MKNFLIVALMLLSLSSFSQDKWRTLTVGNTSGFNIHGDFISTTSTNLSYELKNKFAITSWTGLQYNPSHFGWISNQTQIVKGLNKGWNIGTGLLYNSGTAPIDLDMNTLYYTVSISKRFKLNSKKSAVYEKTNTQTTNTWINN